MNKAPTLAEALRWLDAITAAGAPTPRVTGPWPPEAVLAHLAQSIEMSLTGFPQPRPAWFRATVGPLALAAFRRRGAMRHPLDAPIPGAPALPQDGDWRSAALRLRSAIEAFEAHTGPLAPHFAYGALDKAAYGQAHALHIANHREAWAAGESCRHA